MKHNLKVTLFLLILFLATQIIGLFIFSRSIIVEKRYNEETGKTDIVVNYTEVFTGRPDTSGQESFYFILISILIGTALVLLIIKFSLFKVWKGWFFFAVSMTLAIALSVFISDVLALVIGVILAYLKIFRPNIFTHNLSEILMYAGIAVMLVPIFGDPSKIMFGFPENVFWAAMLLVVISIYDAIAVWKSKHMIKMAQFQAKNKMFAGLLIPYSGASEAPEMHQGKAKANATAHGAEIRINIPKNMEDKGVKSAILGGGDIAFPMLFTGAAMEALIRVNGLTRDAAFLRSLIIPAFVGGALFILLYKGKKNTFYPAMPFISLGCAIGYLVLMMIP
jgi:presenilin-like A22 family membrane protease